MKDSNKFPWRTMMFWDSWPEDVGVGAGRHSVNMSGCPECDYQVLWETIWKLRDKAEKLSPMQGRQHCFAAILTLYSEEEGDVEIIDCIKHEQAKVKTIKRGDGFSTREIFPPPEVPAFMKRICTAFPELCKDFID